MRASRTLIVPVLMGAQLCWGAPGRAQTLAPVDEPAEAPAQKPEAVSPAPAAARKLDKATVDEARRSYTAGEAAFRAGDHKAAIQSFRNAQSILPSPHAAYWLALSLKADGKIPEAIAELKTLLSSSASDRLGPEKIQTAKAALAEMSTTPGVVALTTEPVGATVSVDGDVRPEVSPLSLQLAPGAHTLTLSMPGYQSMELEIDVPPGSKGEQTFTLEALPPPPAPVAGTPSGEPSQGQRIVVQPTGAARSGAGKLGMFAVFGLAGAGALAGAFALADKHAAEKSSSDDASARADRDDVIAGLGLGAAVTFGLAGLVMATSKDDPAAPQGEPAHDGATARTTFGIAPCVSRTGAGAAAAFTF